VIQIMVIIIYYVKLRGLAKERFKNGESNDDYVKNIYNIAKVNQREAPEVGEGSSKYRLVLNYGLWRRLY